MTSRTSYFSEKNFEEFFLRHPVLPNEGWVLVVARQQSLHRVVDLLALDQAGALIIIEVKNERTTRTVVGQSLEYLSQYEGVTQTNVG